MNDGYSEVRKIKKNIKNIGITMITLVLAFVLCLVIDNFFYNRSLIPAIFVLAVYIISVLTEGYTYGAIASLISVLAVNFAFTFPFFKFDFTIHENVVSAVIMIIVTLVTGTLTTKLKQQEAIKAESEKERMRANLLRAVSHDLRTPLTSIYGSSSTIIDNYELLSDERKLQLLDGIKNDSDWLARMVENLLSITKLDGGKTRLVKTPVVVEELVDSVLQKISRRHPAIKINIDMPDELLIVPMDAMLIEQVMINIINNSIFHGECTTTINLRIFSENNKCIFEISDDGKGIAADKLKSILSGAHLTAENTLETKNSSGIGLSVCNTIVRAHGGEIHAENIKGGGAMLRFTLDMEETVIEQQI